MAKYRKRIADALLAEKLSYMGAVLVHGPKWCGKTTTSRQAVESEVSLNFGDRPHETLDFIGYRGACPQNFPKF